MSTRRTMNLVFLSAAILVSMVIPATAATWSVAQDTLIEEDALHPDISVVPAEGPAPVGASITTSGTVWCNPPTNTSSCWLYAGASWKVEFDDGVFADELWIQLNNSDDNDGTMHVDVNADDVIDFSLYTGQPPNTYRHIRLRGTGIGRINSVKIIASEDGDVSLDYIAHHSSPLDWVPPIIYDPFWWIPKPDIYFDQDILPIYAGLVPAEGPPPPGATITTSAGVLSVPGVKSSSLLIFPGEWWMIEFNHPVAADRLRIQLNDSDDDDGTMHVDVDADGTIDYSYLTRQPAGISRDTLVLGGGFRAIRAVKIIAAIDGEVSIDYVALGRQLTIFPTADGRWSGGEWRGSPDEVKAIPWTDVFVPAEGPEPDNADIDTSSETCPFLDTSFCWLYAGDWWKVDLFPDVSYLKMYIRFRDCDNNDGWAEIYVNDTLQVAYDSYYPTEPGNNPTNGLLVGRGLPPISSVEIKTIPGAGDVSLDYVAFSDPPIPPN